GSPTAGVRARTATPPGERTSTRAGTIVPRWKAWPATGWAWCGKARRSFCSYPAPIRTGTRRSARELVRALPLRFRRTGRPAERGEVDAPEPHPRWQDRHHLGQAADDPDEDSRRQAP